MRELTYGQDPSVTRIITGHFVSQPGYGVIRPDGSKTWICMLTLNGAGVVNGQTVGPGDLATIQPLCPHSYGIAEGAEVWEFLWTHFHPWPHWNAWLPSAKTSLVNTDRTADPDRVVDRFWEMHRNAISQGPHRDSLAMNALEEALLRTQSTAESKPFDSRVQAALVFAGEHLKESIGVPDVANALGLSVSRVTHLFREVMGMSFGTYLEGIRIERARGLLELTNYSVSWIGEECGFESLYYFSLRFKRSTGVSPSQYRKNAQERAENS